MRLINANSAKDFFFSETSGTEEIIGDLAEKHNLTYLNDVNEDEVMSFAKDLLEAAQNVIETEPTAFDIEKVMKFLEEREQLAYKRYMDTPSNSPCYVRYQTQYYERKQILDFMKGLLEENK